MTTIVWSTESVDTSAMLLAHALEDAIFTKTYSEEVAEALVDAGDDATIILYGLVNLPWEDIVDDVGQEAADKIRVLHPRTALRELVHRYAVLQLLSEEFDIDTVMYRKLRTTTTFQEACNSVGADEVMLVNKAIGNTVGIASTDDEFAAMRTQGATHYCKKIEPVLKARVFLTEPGAPHLGTDGVSFATVSEFKTLSFYELLTKAASEDVKAHLDMLFEHGYLTEDMGKDMDKNGWSEVTGFTDTELLDTFGDTLFATASKVAKAIQHAYGDFDFTAVDLVVVEHNGTRKTIVSNVVSSPSLQDDFVLEHASLLFNKLVTVGRQPTKEAIKKMVDLIDEDKLVEAVKALGALK